MDRETEKRIKALLATEYDPNYNMDHEEKEKMLEYLKILKFKRKHMLDRISKIQQYLGSNKRIIKIN